MGLKRIPTRSGARLLCLAVVLTAGSAAPVRAASEAAGVRVIAITQTACQFVEPEKGNLDFRSTGYDDCKKINRETWGRRSATARVLRLKPGKYVFRVSNRGVPYNLGFWLRGTGPDRLRLPKVSGAGLLPGETKDYAIELVEGDYLYSCPLNPTPDYRLQVRN